METIVMSSDAIEDLEKKSISITRLKLAIVHMHTF